MTPSSPPTVPPAGSDSCERLTPGLREIGPAVQPLPDTAATPPQSCGTSSRPSGKVGSKGRRTGSVTPTQRTLKRLRDMGYTAAVVEHWNPHAKIRQDLFGFIDVLALGDGEVLAVQACSGTDAAARVRKIADHPNVGAVRKAGIRIEVWAWRKLADGKWHCRVEDCS